LPSIINPLIELPLDKAYQFGIENNLQDEISNIKNMQIDWGPAYQPAIRRGFIVDLFVQKGIFSAFQDIHWPNGKTKYGKVQIQSYLKIKKCIDLSNDVSPEAKELVQTEAAKSIIINNLMEILNNLANMSSRGFHS
jgi:hypothetical protein